MRRMPKAERGGEGKRLIKRLSRAGMKKMIV